MLKRRKIIVAVTGASGAVYARLLLDQFEKGKDHLENLSLIFSQNAKMVWQHELETDYTRYSFDYHDQDDFFSPPASGSSGYDTMIIIPCSMGTLGKIANGIADNLITRAADVMLKEKKQLIMVTRESPLNLIHIENMKKVVIAGVVILPASPSFYSKPANKKQIISTVTDKVFQIINFPGDYFRWGS